MGDARDNQFTNNTFTGAGLHFQPYKGTARSPSNNRVTGGAITDAPECVRFTSTRGNVVDGHRARYLPDGGAGRSPSGPSDNTLIGAPSAALTLDEGSTLSPRTTGERSRQGCGRGARRGGKSGRTGGFRRQHVDGRDGRVGSGPLLR